MVTPLNVGFSIPALSGGGAEFVVKRWAGELANRGHQVSLFTYSDEAQAHLVPEGVQHSNLEARGRKDRLVSLPRWLRRESEKRDLDVLVPFLTFTNLAAIVGMRLGARPTSTKVVISERNVPTTYLPVEGHSGSVERGIARKLYRYADAAIAISHPVAADLIGGYRMHPRDVFVVPNPVTDVVPMKPLTLPSTLRVGFAGRLVAQKRPDLFVRTLVAIRDMGVNVVGVVVGDGPERSNMAGAAQRAGIEIEFRGWRSPWTQEAGTMDCLLLTSSVEGFGNVLVEATSAGVPCVAWSSALGVADAVVPGVTGLLSVTDDPVEFADLCCRSRELQPLAFAGQGWSGHFSLKESVDRVERALTYVAVRAR